jgi:hypothetical protein
MRATTLLLTTLVACGTAASTDEPRVAHQAAGRASETPARDGERASEPAAPHGDRVHARHILVQYRGAHRAPTQLRRSKDEARTRADELLARVRAEGADFTAIARENSDGPSAARGGDLGSFGRGIMHPIFERTAFELPVGAISDVIETPFGFHIVQRYQ